MAIVKCRCGEKIIWMKTKIGKGIPVNYHPDIAKDKEFDFHKPNTVAHFSTCKFTENFRKQKQQ